DGSVTKWTAINPAGGGIGPGNQTDLTVFNGNAWFSGNAGGVLGNQLYKLGFDGSVTRWTGINNLNPTPGNAEVSFKNFENAMWFNGAAPGQGTQLYKLGFDGSVTKWTALNGAAGLNPQNMFEFANALWFSGQTAAQGQQLFKLGADGKVTQWTAINPGGGGVQPFLISKMAFDGLNLGDQDSTPSSIFQNAAWLSGVSPTSGRELFKLGADGSVTLWKDINPGAGSSFPSDWARFA